MISLYRASLATIEEEMEALRKALEEKAAAASVLREEVKRNDADVHKIENKLELQRRALEERDTSVVKKRSDLK